VPKTGTIRPRKEKHPVEDEKSARSVEDLAEGQYGRFTLDQALASGMTRTTLYRRTRAGRYVLEHPGVFRFAGLPDRWEGTALAACLAAGDQAFASHRAAARIWGLTDDSDGTVEITVRGSRHPRLQGVTVHRSADLRTNQTTIRRRIPVTNPLRTMVDLAAVLEPDAVEDALDAGLRYPALFSLRAIEATLQQLAGKGRGGTRALRTILYERIFGDTVTDSELEKQMGKLLRRAGLPPAVFHHVVRTPAGLFLAEVDFAYPEIRLAIEVDGSGVHGTPRAMAKDFVRQNGLAPFRWHVLRFTWRQVTDEPEMVAATIRRTIEALQAA
jgi:very-short-patch-repair endonuclease